MANPQEVNRALVQAFHNLQQVGQAAIGGNAFDDTVFNTILHCLTRRPLHFRDVSARDWTRDYPGYKQRSTNRNFDFRGLTPSQGAQPDELLVRQPNGSQNWPDIAVINNLVGLPLEIKSSRTDKIVWNSGLPLPGRIYVFGCYATGQVTYFLGDDILTPQEEQLLRQMDAASKNACVAGNAQLAGGGSTWTYYPRPMYNSTATFFGATRAAREARVIQLLNNLVW